MSGLPTVQVLLDDGSGTFPYDVSAYADLKQGISIQRGRQDEFSVVDPGHASLTLKNNDGRFTLGATSPYVIKGDQRLRINYVIGGTTYNRFTGYVEAWPTTWAGGNAFAADSHITVVDRLARLQRKTFRSFAEEEVLSDGPAALYMLNEPDQNAPAGDTSGANQTTLSLTGSGAVPTYGGATADFGADAQSAMLMNGGYYFTGVFLSGSAYTVTFDFGASAPPAATQAVLGFGSTVNKAVVMSTGGQLGIFNAAAFAGPNLADGKWHTATVFITGGVWTLYVDGASITSGSAAVPTSLGLEPGGQSAGLGVAAFHGSMSRVAGWQSALATARHSDHFRARLGNPVESSTARMTRLAKYCGIASADSVTSGDGIAAVSDIGPQTISGVAIEAMRAVATAEAGEVTADTLGRLSFLITAGGTGHAPVSTVTLGGSDVQGDLTFPGDKQYLVNIVSASRNGGATQTSRNTASIAQYGDYPLNIGALLLPTDTWVGHVIAWMQQVYGDIDKRRCSQITVDLLTRATTFQQSMLPVDIGKAVTLQSLPSQAPTTSVVLNVEGTTESLSTSGWTISLNTSPVPATARPTS